MRYKKVFLIGNPIAGGGVLNRIKKAEKILKNKGISVETLLTQTKGDAERFAKKITENRNSENSILVIAAGGDGTYNEVANGLVFSSVPLAILPMGTTSVLAKELKIPDNIEKSINIALTGDVQKIHLGRIKNQQKQRLFILMVGIGFDAEAIFRVSIEKKRYLKKIAYILSGIETLMNYAPDEIEFFNSINKKAYSAVVCKASCYGGSFKIAPHASLKDPWFYAFLSKTNSKIFLSLQIIGVLFRVHLKMKNIDYFKTEYLKISGNAYVHTDGDYFGRTPVEIEIVKDALNLVFPEGS